MPHVTSEDLAGYLEHRLDRESTRQVETHMAECAACRADLVQVRALLGPLPGIRQTAQHRSWLRRGWLAAAALAGVALVPLARRAEQRQAPAHSLRTAASSATRIAVVAPDPAAQQRPIDPDKVVFTWRAVDGAGTYRITVTDSAGTPVFTTTTADTSIMPPRPHLLAHGGSYLWYVDALRGDGTTWSTGVQSFSTTR